MLWLKLVFWNYFVLKLERINIYWLCYIWIFWLVVRFEYFFLLEINFYVFIYLFGVKRKIDKDGNKKNCIWKF